MRFDYPDRVNVERGVITTGDYGSGQIRTWAVVHRHLPCRVTTLSGSEAAAYNTVQAKASHVMSCAFVQIKTTDRIIWGGKKLNIEAVIDNKGVRGAGRRLKVILAEVEGRGE